ncbi:MAG: radical SAM protein [Defluviitaleaceae bacterium]|nr:radical SAM protein [Defluviitaleaceae bacterium]
MWEKQAKDYEKGDSSMTLSHDISIIATEKDQCKIYNRHLNKLSSVHVAIYTYLENAAKTGITDAIYKDLSGEQIDTLIEYGVLVDDEDTYLKRKFKNTHEKFEHNLNTAYMYLTMKCNLFCEYCFMASNLGDDKPCLSTADWKKALEQIKVAGATSVILTGGEAILHEGFEEIVQHAASLGLHVTVLSNGTLFSEDRLDIMRYIDSVIISLDGLIDSRRKGIDEYPVFDNILNIAEKYPKKVSVRSVISRGYEKDVKELSAELARHGIPHTKSICIPTNVSEIEKIPDHDKNNDLYESGLGGHCGAGSNLIALDSLGNIFPCQTLVQPEFKIANILDSDWLDKFTKNDFPTIINCFDPYNEPECQDCVAINFCTGGCRSIAYYVYNDLNRRNDFFCGFYRAAAVKHLKQGTT